MEAKTLMPIQPARTIRSIILNSHIPIRVLLLSHNRLLRDALARALKSRTNISLVGTQESLLGFTAETIESTCDVLLVDPLNRSTLDAKFLDHLQIAFPNLRIVTIDMEARVVDVISAALPGSQTYQDLAYTAGRSVVAVDGKS